MMRGLIGRGWALIRIDLPFPPSSLSGHAKGASHWGKSSVTKKWRQLAHDAAWDAVTETAIPEAGDIGLHIHFIPKDRRGDRTNFWIRCKPIIDGVAEALGVNDARFLPSMSFGAPEKPGRLVISIDMG
jgi:hypothetical protein